MLGEGPSARPFYVRRDSIGDMGAMQKVFGDQEYRLDGLPQAPAVLAYYFDIVESGRKPLIFDAGANIGAASVFYALKFPEARIHAIEPERENAELLRRNCKGLNYQLSEGGLGSLDGVAHITDPGQSDWAFQLGDSGMYEVPVFSASRLVLESKSQGLTPFLLKLDIEGSERDVFSLDNSWLAEFAVVVIELHDWLFPFQGSSTNFLRAIVDYGFDVVARGENFFCFNGAILRSFMPKPS